MECITSVGATVLDPETKGISDAKRLDLNGINSPELEAKVKECVDFTSVSKVLEAEAPNASLYIKSESICYYPTETGCLLFIKYMGEEEEKITLNTQIPGPVLDQLSAAKDRDEMKEILAANNIEYNKDADRTVTRDGELKEEIAESEIGGNIEQTREMDSDERAKYAPEGPDKYGYDRRKEEERVSKGIDR